jgi:hypothetical protein
MERRGIYHAAGLKLTAEGLFEGLGNTGDFYEKFVLCRILCSAGSFYSRLFKSNRPYRHCNNGKIPTGFAVFSFNYKILKAQFAAGGITIDGNLNEAAWNTAKPSTIVVFKHPSNAEDAGNGIMGTIKSVWDGYTLYVGIIVNDTAGGRFHSVDALYDAASQPLSRRSLTVTINNPGDGCQHGKFSPDSHPVPYL